MFRTILVLDIFNSIVVHAIRGRREEYKPVSDFSRVCDTSDAVEIVRRLRPAEVYAADLNRIRGIGDNFPVIRELSRYCRTILSCGVRSPEDVSNGLMIADTVTIGTENADFNVIREACELNDSKRIDVNIDLMENKILTNTRLSLTPLEAVEELNDYPISHLIIIDLSRVGTEGGINIDLLEDVVSCSDHPIIFGGGVRDRSDLETLREIGVRGGLVATAIHNRSIPLELLR